MQQSNENNVPNMLKLFVFRQSFRKRKVAFRVSSVVADERASEGERNERGDAAERSAGEIL